MRAYGPIIGIYCLALLVRLVYNVTAVSGYTPIFDAAIYNNIAHKLVDEHCYCLYSHLPSVSRAPLWPFIMAAIYSLVGKHDFYARLFYCLLGSGTCAFVYLLAKDLFGRRIAFWTGIMAAIYTGLFIYDGWLFTESLYTFCLIVFTYGLYRLQQASEPPAELTGNDRSGASWWWKRVTRLRWLVLCGVFLALATLTRPNGPALVGLLCLWAISVIVAKLMPWQAAVRSVVIITCIGTLLITPWIIRNYVVTGRFVLVATGMGTVLLGAYNDEVLQNDPVVLGMWRPPAHTNSIQDSAGYTPGDDSQDVQRALTWIRAHPGQTLYLLSLHFVNMWKPYTFVPGLPFAEFPNRPASQVVYFLVYYMPIPVLLLAGLGLFVTWKTRRKPLLVIYLVILTTTLQNVAFYSNLRFRSPIEPALVLLAGGALWWLFSFQPGTLRFWLKSRRPVFQEPSDYGAR